MSQDVQICPACSGTCHNSQPTRSCWSCPACGGSGRKAKTYSELVAERIAALPRPAVVFEPEGGEELSGMTADETEKTLRAVAARDQLLADILWQLKTRGL